MTIKYQQFYYGLEITGDNRYLDFNDGADKTATLKIGTYTFLGLSNEIARAMNTVTTIEVTSSINRTTRISEISAASAFTILGATGPYSATNVLSLIGFEAIDYPSATTQVGTDPSGEVWSPQFCIRGYVPFEENIKAVSSSVNQAASGETESFTFGLESYMMGDFAYINDGFTTDGEIKYSTTGRQDAINFLTYAIGKKKMEFMFDETDPDAFTSCILEKTSSDSKGTGFKLERMGGLDPFKKTGMLTFRRIN